jgi:hypothetical protein
MTSTAARNPSPVRSVDAGGVVGGGPHSRQRVESKGPRRCVRACACAYVCACECVCVRVRASERAYVCVRGVGGGGGKGERDREGTKEHMRH